MNIFKQVYLQRQLLKLESDIEGSFSPIYKFYLVTLSKRIKEELTLINKINYN